MLLPKTLQLREHFLMGNAIWFIILAVLSVLLLIYTFWRKKDLKLVALYLGLSAIAGFLEDVIFIWLQSYEYYPHILKIPYYDMALGAYLSIFYISSVAVFIAAFNLGYGWILFFTAMFVVIEHLFLALGIYKLNWWHPGYTGVGVLIYFRIAKKWYSFLLKASSRFIRLITLFCTNYTLYSNLIIIPTLFNHYRFVVGWFEDPARDTAAAVIVYMIIRGFITAMVCFYRLHWAILASVPILMWISYLVLIHLHIMTFKHLWDLLLFAASDIVVLLCCYYFNRVLSKAQQRNLI
jgi:hypothetical protein